MSQVVYRNSAVSRSIILLTLMSHASHASYINPLSIFSIIIIKNISPGVRVRPQKVPPGFPVQDLRRADHRRQPAQDPRAEGPPRDIRQEDPLSALRERVCG